MVSAHSSALHRVLAAGSASQFKLARGIEETVTWDPLRSKMRFYESHGSTQQAKVTWDEQHGSTETKDRWTHVSNINQEKGSSKNGMENDSMMEQMEISTCNHRPTRYRQGPVWRSWLRARLWQVLLHFRINLVYEPPFDTSLHLETWARMRTISIKFNIRIILAYKHVNMFSYIIHHDSTSIKTIALVLNHVSIQLHQSQRVESPYADINNNTLQNNNQFSK